MDVIGFRVPKELRKSMREIDINWSEEIGKFIERGQLRELRNTCWRMRIPRPPAEVSNAIWKHYAIYEDVPYKYAKKMFDALKKLGHHRF